MPKDSSVSYREAKENSSLRQPYLDALMQSCPNSVSALVYDPDSSKVRYHIYDLVLKRYYEEWDADILLAATKGWYAGIICPPSLFARGESHPIFVAEKSFAKFSESSFLSTILDHECSHAEDDVNGMRMPGLVINSDNYESFTPETLVCLREIRACEKQIDNFAARGVTENYYQSWVRCMKSEYENELSHIKPISQLEANVIIPAVCRQTFSRMFQ